MTSEQTPATPAAAAATETPEVQTPETHTAAELAELREQLAEANRTAQYWAEQARTRPAPAAAPAADREADPDVLEAITTGGVKGFDDVAQKRGFIKRTEVEQLINERANALTTEQQLMARFPDLKDKSSGFFKDTAVHYGTLIKQGVPQATAMTLAAEKAELEGIRSGKILVPGTQHQQPSRAQKEQERLSRIAAQADPGGNGRRPAASAEEDDTELTPEQKHIARSMGISEEAYAKRAKGGVAVTRR